jgi:hypothetical protein
MIFKEGPLLGVEGLAAFPSALQVDANSPPRPSGKNFEQSNFPLSLNDIQPWSNKWSAQGVSNNPLHPSVRSAGDAFDHGLM